MIAIVDYGSGNIQAIANIFGRLSVPHRLAKDPEQLADAEKIVLPGVGAFDQAMGDLEASGMRRALDECVIGRKKPVLGICVGMQLLARSSEEGSAPGLGWIDAEVKKFDHSTFGQETQLPHMGWNTVQPLRPDALFDGVEMENGYYFLHSYYFACARADDSLAVTEYGATFTSAVRRDNVYGVQFHPEKSHQNGIQLLKNFASL